MRRTRVFLSYTHDSDTHKKRVLTLAQQLRNDGLLSIIDQYINGNPDEGWPLWMERQIEQADFVLVVCSSAYHRRFRGEESAETGLGGVWESVLTRQAMYQNQGKNSKFIPIIFPDASVADIPAVMRFQYTHYVLMEMYEELLRQLTSQPSVIANPVGTTKILSANESIELDPTLVQDALESAFTYLSEDNSDEFSRSIHDHMALLNRNVERLTQDQFRVIRLLRFLNRVRVSGCAGSGKTLVAGEKAIRLSKAGLKTLFLCHNPLLAEYVTHLTMGAGVQVWPFGSWVAWLAGDSPGSGVRRWTNYEEPDSQTIERAFYFLIENGPRFDAIIVDEGQDFRDEWWAIVEAALSDIRASILYIFHDDRQALLPYRSSYPIKEPVVDLSRNCRNSGNVYELMRHFYPEAPIAEPDLEDQGRVLIHQYNAGSEKEAIERGARWIFESGYGEHFVLLLGGSQSVENSQLSGEYIRIPTIRSWQKEIRRYFEDVIPGIDQSGVVFPSGGLGWIRDQLEQLSTGPVPNADDTELVRDIVGRFHVNPALRLTDASQFWRAEWIIKDGRLELKLPSRSALLAGQVLMHLEQGRWEAAIPEPRILALRPYDSKENGDSIRMYNVADFKGLESDAVLLIVRGGMPMIEQQLYVGISRARFLLVVLVDKGTSCLLPDPSAVPLKRDRKNVRA